MTGRQIRCGSGRVLENDMTIFLLSLCRLLFLRFTSVCWKGTALLLTHAMYMDVATCSGTMALFISKL